MIAVAVLSGSLSAATTNWTAEDGGLFSVGTNWDNGVPGSLDIAVYGIDAEYTVTFGGNTENDLIRVRDGVVTFDVGNFTYTINSAAGTSNQNVQVGNTGEGDAVLRLISGQILSRNASIADLNGSTGRLEVSGSGTQFDQSGNFFIRVGLGSNSAGEILVESGGSIDTRNFELGFHSSGTGTATITGATSSVNARNQTFVGVEGTGTLLIESGAKLTGAGTTRIGSSAGSNGTATVTGTGSNWATQTTFAVGSAGNGTLTIGAGGSVTSTGIGFIGQSSGSTGTATVTGNDSIWNLASDLFVGGGATEAGGTGTLQVVNQGEVAVVGGTTVWGSGTLTVDAGFLSAATITFNSGSKLNYTLYSSTADAGITAGTAALGDTELILALGTGFSGSFGQVFTLLDYSTSLTGTFLGLNDGAVIDVDGVLFELSYGDLISADSVTLTVIPEPGVFALLLAACVVAVVIRRRRG